MVLVTKELIDSCRRARSRYQDHNDHDRKKNKKQASAKDNKTENERRTAFCKAKKRRTKK